MTEMPGADPFVAQLADLCWARPTRAKWVIVSSHAFGHALGERLAREGTDWATLRFKTPFDLALEIPAPLLVECGIDPLGDELGPALTMRLLAGLPPAVATASLVGALVVWSYQPATQGKPGEKPRLCWGDSGLVAHPGDLRSPDLDPARAVEPRKCSPGGSGHMTGVDKVVSGWEAGI